MTGSNPSQTSPRANKSRTSSATVDRWHAATPSRSARHPPPRRIAMEQAQQWTLSHAGGDPTTIADPTNPLRDPALDTRAGPQPARHFRIRAHRLKEGRTKPPTRERSQGTGQASTHTDAHAQDHIRQPSWTSAYRHHQSTAPALRTHRLAKAATSVRLTCPLARSGSGDPCTDHHQTPTHALRNLQTVHPIRTQGPTSKQTDSQPPQGHQTQPHP